MRSNFHFIQLYFHYIQVSVRFKIIEVDFNKIEVKNAGRDARAPTIRFCYALELTWKDETLLQVRPKHPKMLLKQMKEEQERNEKYQAHRKRMDDIFHKKYQLVTKVYSLKTITPVTAKTVVDPLLETYVLAYFFVEIKPIKIIEREGDYIIASTPDTAAEVKSEGGKRNALREFAVEQAVADEKSNTLIVTAIQTTHEKIGKMLARMEERIRAEKQQRIPETYQIEVVLLEGGTRPLPATEKDRESVEQLLNKKLEGPYTSKEINLKNVLDVLQKKSGIEFVLEEGVSPKVSFDLQDPTVKEILNGILNLHNLHYSILDKEKVWIGEKNGPHDGWTFNTNLLEQYGITQKDLELFEFNAVRVLGKGIVNLIAERGEVGTAQISLTEQYHCTVVLVQRELENETMRVKE